MSLAKMDQNENQEMSWNVKCAFRHTWEPEPEKLDKRKGSKWEGSHVISII